jgi:hypothetical protein
MKNAYLTPTLATAAAALAFLVAWGVAARAQDHGNTMECGKDLDSCFVTHSSIVPYQVNAKGELIYDKGVDGPGLWQCDEDQAGPMKCHRPEGAAVMCGFVDKDGKVQATLAAPQCAVKTSHVADTQEERHKICEDEIDARIAAVPGLMVCPYGCGGPGNDARSQMIHACVETSERAFRERHFREEAAKRDAARRDELLRKFRTGK